jgi:hypothetical protein
MNEKTNPKILKRKNAILVFSFQKYGLICNFTNDKPRNMKIIMLTQVSITFFIKFERETHPSLVDGR